MLTLASFGDFCQPGCSCEIAEDVNFEINNLQTPSKPTQLNENSLCPSDKTALEPRVGQRPAAGCIGFNLS